MDEFVKQTGEQARRALREISGQEPLPWENPIVELMGLLLGDGYGEVQAPPTIPITIQQWLDWHYLALMVPETLTAAMNRVLRANRRQIPREQEAMRTWAASVLLGTLDQLELM